ncbi:unnamed protein product [Mycena citricolor]|uniref:DDE-1 domain-containing protein n=1 Tax=Mycena citricolor TaxID=2018698 RepID=A0AAD2H9M3_9AGAR|nr:unnamed protein product [Mycena citricolor]
MTGHSSHYSEKFLDFARKNNIILLGYPPHCTHALQGLDVVCFSKMKECWKREIAAFEARMKRDVTKAEFLTVWSPAYKAAFDEKTVQAAFRVTGVVPFNPNFVSAEQLAPSQATSTCGEFPMLQPSPVRRITQAMALHHPTRLERSSDLLELSPPSTPTRRPWNEPENKDLDPWTPSKKMRTLYAHLGSTSAGSLLLSTPKITSRTNPIRSPVIQSMPSKLPAPNWNLAMPGSSKESWKTRSQLEAENEELKEHLKRAQAQSVIKDHMLGQANATMVLQNITLKKTNEALHQQEERATNERARLFKGQAQCLSSDEFFSEVQRINKEKETRDAEKLRRKTARSDRKAAKAALDEQWVKMKADHASDVAMWDRECAELVKTGARKKDLPPKPKLPRKPLLPRLEEEADDDDDDDDDVDQEQDV